MLILVLSLSYSSSFLSFRHSSSLPSCRQIWLLLQARRVDQEQVGWAIRERPDQAEQEMADRVELEQADQQQVEQADQEQLDQVVQAKQEQ